MQTLRWIAGGFVICAMTAACGSESRMFDGPAPTPMTIGSGRFVSESRSVRGFSTVVLSGGVHAVVTHTGVESLEITAEDNILPLLDAAVIDGRLVLGWRAGSHSVSTHGVTFRIGASGLRGVTASSGCQIEVEGIQEQDFVIDLSGAAVFSGSGSVDRLDLTITGASRVQAPGLTARVAHANLSGASAVLLRVVDALSANVSGASLLEFLGDPAVQADTSGASVVRRAGQ